MKRVRYAIGAIGVAPALGLMMPAANAAATVPQAPGSAGKTVSLQHRLAAQPVPLVNCASGRRQDATSTHGYMTASIAYSHRCINCQYVGLAKTQTGLTERTRFYSYKGALERTTWQEGHIHQLGGYTSFQSYPNLNGYEVCEALVANGNHNDVKYGPICERATS